VDTFHPDPFRWGRGRKLGPAMFGAPPSLTKKQLCYMFNSKTDKINWAYVSC